MNIPKLRFKSKNGGIFPAWSEKTLAELTDVFKSGQGITSNRIRAEGEYPVYGGNGLRGYAEEFTHDGYYALIGRQGALCGNINTVDGKTFISEHAIAVKAKQDSSTQWLAIKLELMNLNRLSESSAQPGLAVNKLLKLKVNSPCIEEQEKIAAFIGAIDQKISLLTKKHELLIQYKKGVMQKIFNQEIRFQDKGGNDYPKWELKKIGDTLTIGSGRDYKHLSPGNIPVYGTGGFMLSVNDFLYDGVSACIGRKGTIDKPVLLSGKFWTVDTLFYTHKFINCSPEFIYACFQMINWKSYCEASGVPSLSKSTIEAIEINLPCIAEQKQITDFFATLDNKITNIKSKLALSKQYKQGLLQQMFI